MAEQLSAAGVPVFLADIKGDVSGMAAPAAPSERITERMAENSASPGPRRRTRAEFLTLGGKGIGVPVRATVTDFGPLLLSKVLDLTEVQQSSLNLVFHFADQKALPLVDIKDLRAVIQYLVSAEGAAELKGRALGNGRRLDATLRSATHRS